MRPAHKIAYVDAHDLRIKNEIHKIISSIAKKGGKKDEFTDTK